MQLKSNSNAVPCSAILSPILSAFTQQIIPIYFEKVDDFNPDVLEFATNVIRFYLYGFDKYINADSIAKLSVCFNRLSYVDYSYFYEFINEKLPQNAHIARRQKLIMNLLKIVFNNVKSTERYDSLSILKYAINGIVGGCKRFKQNVKNGQTTIWTHNNYELAKYFMANTLVKDKMEKFSEPIRAEIIHLICLFMERCDSNWWRKDTDFKLNHAMWQIYKNKDSKVGVASRLYACKALLIFNKYYGDETFLKNIDGILRPFLKNNHQFCCGYMSLLQSIFEDYIIAFIKMFKRCSKSDDECIAFFVQFIAFILDFYSKKTQGVRQPNSISDPALIWKCVLNALLTHREHLSRYFDQIILLYRAILRDHATKSDELSVSLRVTMLESIRTYSKWMQSQSISISNNQTMSKLQETYMYSWNYIFRCIQQPPMPAYVGKMSGGYASSNPNATLLIRYAMMTAKDLIKVSRAQSQKNSLLVNWYHNHQSTTWQYQHSVISTQLNDPYNTKRTAYSNITQVYYQFNKQLAVLRIFNLLLKPKSNSKENVYGTMDYFVRNDLQKVVEFFTSLTVSQPLSKELYDRTQTNKKSALYHGKYWNYDYDDFGEEMDDYKVHYPLTRKKDSKHQKVSHTTTFMDCDEIYFEEMNNLIIRVSAFAKYLSEKKHMNANKDTGERLLLSLTDLKVHHAGHTKIWNGLMKVFQSYYQKVSQLQPNDPGYNKEIKHAKVGVVMNSFVFRFWESMFKASIMGRKQTIKCLSYLAEFGGIIFEDYRLRILKLARLMNTPSLIGTVESWTKHINVFSIPLLKAIAKIICVNCTKYLNEQKLLRPWDPQANVMNARYDQKGTVKFYPLFLDMFGSLFSFQTGIKENIQIHQDLLYDIGLMVKDNLIKTTAFNQIDLKMKCIEAMRQTFPRQPKLEDIYVDCVQFILSGIQDGSIGDEVIPKPIYMATEYTDDSNSKPWMQSSGTNDQTSTHFVRSFLECLCLANKNERLLFRGYMQTQIKSTFMDRLSLVYGGADWVEIGDKYWLTPGLDLILDLFDDQSNISLHHPNAKSLQSIKYFNNGKNTFNISELINNKEMNDLIRFEQQMLYKRSTLKSCEILNPLTEWMYYSPKIAQNLWLQIIVPITEKLSADQHKSLLDSFHSMLLIDTDIGFEAYHLSEDDEHECCDPLKTIMKGISLNAPVPFPDFGWNIIVRCAYYHSCWFECLDIINNYLIRVLSIPDHTTKHRAAQGYDIIETPEFTSVANLFDDLYKELGADDIATSFWKTRCVYSGTMSALTLKQFGYWDQMQHQLWKNQLKMQKRMKKVSEAEGVLWQKDWLLACKKLGHWQILEQRANDQKIPEWQLEAQSQLGKWAEFNELLQFHDEAEDDPGHCKFKSFQYQLYSEMSKMIAPNGFNFDDQNNGNQSHDHYHGHNKNNRLTQQQILATDIKTDKIVDIVTNSMPTIISRSFKKLPEFITSIHAQLLHETHLFVEIEEGIDCLDKIRSLFVQHSALNEPQRQVLEEPLKKIVNRWRQRLPNIYEGLDIWSDIFSFRVNCFEFGSYYQKQPERNSLVFHDRAWTIIQLSKHARNSNCYNSALLILSKIMSMKRMDARDFYLRIKEQVAIAKMNVNESNEFMMDAIHLQQNGHSNHNGHGNGDKSNKNSGLQTPSRRASSIERALHILNIANLKYFTELQKSELFSIKAEIKQKLQLLDDSNASYSASLAIAGDNWKAWTKWGDFCNDIYSAKQDYRWAMYAMISYLCSLHGGDELTRAYWPDNLMNPIHPNYPKSSHAQRNSPFHQHPYVQRQPYTDDVLQKHGDPEKDLQHSNYHHLVIPRILMLLQAAKSGPEEQESVDKDSKKNSPQNSNANGHGQSEEKNDIYDQPHRAWNYYENAKSKPPKCVWEEKVIPTRTNSEFIRYLYDGVMKLPPHVFLDYIPQLISGLYRYEKDACFLILNDHIRFIAPQYLFYYVLHYKKTHESQMLGMLIRKYKQGMQQVAVAIKTFGDNLGVVHDPIQRNKIETERNNYIAKSKQYQDRVTVADEMQKLLQKQDSFRKMSQILGNLLHSNDGPNGNVLQSVIIEQRDLLNRLKAFGSDVGPRNISLLNIIVHIKAMLTDILHRHPTYASSMTHMHNRLDFFSFVFDIFNPIGRIIRYFQSKRSRQDKNKEAVDRYFAKFQSDFGWFRQYKERVEYETHRDTQKMRELLNAVPLKQQFEMKTRLFETAFLWYKHITFRIGVIERSLSKLNTLYGSDLNFYEPGQEIYCPGYIGKTLFRRKPRTDNLPHKLTSKSGDKMGINDKFNRNLWSMDAPSIVRISPKLFLLPNYKKEYYILCSDGQVRSYRFQENANSNQTSLRLIREQQLIKFCNELFKSNRETRKRYLCSNHVANIVPFDSSSIFYQFNDNEVSFAKIVNSYCTQNNCDQISALYTYLKKIQEIHLANEHNDDDGTQTNTSKQELFTTMQKEYFPETMLDDYIAKSLIGSSYKLHSTTAEFFQFKKKFAKSLAFHNLWLSCWRTDKRPLSSYFIRMDTGELIVRGDFGTNLKIFSAQQQRYPSPNSNFPMRLTPNLNYLLTPNLLDAYFTLSLSTMASVMINGDALNGPPSPENRSRESSDMKYLRHFMYIHFREAKLELTKRSIINIIGILDATPVEKLRKMLSNLLDRQLLNSDFESMQGLIGYSKTIAEKIKSLSYPVFAEPPFSFRHYDTNPSEKSSPTNQKGKNPDIDPADLKYVEPMERVSAIVDDVKSIKTICQMPPSWNPFF